MNFLISLFSSIHSCSKYWGRWKNNKNRIFQNL